MHGCAQVIDLFPKRLVSQQGWNIDPAENVALYTLGNIQSQIHPNHLHPGTRAGFVYRCYLALLYYASAFLVEIG